MSAAAPSPAGPGFPGPAPAALIFDLDGTLIDSSYDLTNAVNFARDAYGLEPLTRTIIVTMVGEGARKLCELAMAAELPEGEFENAYAKFVEFYREHCTENTRPYPEVPNVLRELQVKFPLGLVTNKPEEMTRKLLRHLGLEGCFRAVVGGDTVPTKKPHPAGLLRAISSLGAGAKQAVMIGDSGVDAQTAFNAGCRFVFVEWGFAKPGEPGTLRADARAASMRALRHLFLG